MSFKKEIETFFYIRYKKRRTWLNLFFAALEVLFQIIVVKVSIRVSSFIPPYLFLFTRRCSSFYSLPHNEVDFFFSQEAIYVVGIFLLKGITGLDLIISVYKLFLVYYEQYIRYSKLHLYSAWFWLTRAKYNCIPSGIPASKCVEILCQGPQLFVGAPAQQHRKTFWNADSFCWY